MVVPELGGTITVVVLADDGGLLTQPQSMTPKTNILEMIFNFVSSFFDSGLPKSIVDPISHVRYGLITTVSPTSRAYVCRCLSYTAICMVLTSTLVFLDGSQRSGVGTRVVDHCVSI